MTTPPPNKERSGRLVAYIGTYGSDSDPAAGGITALDVASDGRKLTPIHRIAEPREAGYLAYAPSTRTLYAVDERKTDGRGPVEPPAAVHALSVSEHDGSLSALNWLTAPGPRPTFLSLDERSGVLVTANHGDFDHVEHVVQAGDGTWHTQYLYDDSTVLLYALGTDGRLAALRDVQVMEGHGTDPNLSPQAGGHGQASAHAHCAVIDPSGRYVLVGDKGNDRILVYTLGDGLEPTHAYQLSPETGPRHIAFGPAGDRAYVTYEFSSEIASYAFDPSSGQLRLLAQTSTVPLTYAGLNEPAEVRVHPAGNFVYVNNRGEDTLVWFRVDSDGGLTRAGHVSLAESVHPGLAARSFAFDPTGTFLLVADRPADLVRSYAVDSLDGTLTELTETHVAQPAFVEFVQLPG
ncbi:lactonase family protein [Streptomyces sp. BH-SS-21]|uniref:Lactonase family protein n=1 Tax=Streptomyces liliiviolaceus TaxID=2823109 RepID=A0A940Y4L6_9ACTN|nr:lactonase family protein [Streptomyces liliiviolaceus]MBQ0855526.1 lactonase family protein [Streptomyces liliiviolaceus]